MNTKKTLLMIAVLLIGLVFYGCKKSEPPPAPAPAGTMQGMQGHEGHEHATVTDEAAAQAAAEVEQTVCPVMGGAINKALFTEYKGKKVYFCCDGCKEKFEAEPEKYIAKLPQFKN